MNFHQKVVCVEFKPTIATGGEAKCALSVNGGHSQSPPLGPQRHSGDRERLFSFNFYHSVETDSPHVGFGSVFSRSHRSSKTLTLARLTG